MFHSLRLVYRRAGAGGELLLLLADTPRIPIHATRQLRRWARVAKLLFRVAGAISLALLLLGFQFSWYTSFMLLNWCVYCLVLFLYSVLCCTWALSLRLAAALVTARIERVAAAVRAAAAHEDRLDTATWRDTIESPAVELARRTLPMLSAGWGAALPVVCVGYAAIAVGMLALLFENSSYLDHGAIGIFSVLLILGFMLVSASAPVAFAMAPATVSTHCDELKDNLTLLRAKDLEGQARRIDALYGFLDQLNNKQGIGFLAKLNPQSSHGTVIDKAYIAQTTVQVYALLSLVVSYLVSNLGVAGNPSGELRPSGFGCPISWTEVDGECFQLHEDPQIWQAAEAMCQTHYNAHLATVNSPRQNDAVLAMLEATARVSTSCGSGMYMQPCNQWVWIGLSDHVQEGDFQWSSGQPVNIKPPWDAAFKEPTMDNEGQGPTFLQDCGSVAEDDFVALIAPGGSRNGKWHTWWGAIPPSCEPTQHYYVCSKPATPNVADGGTMYGCVDGHWVMGYAHNNSDVLPPTTVHGGEGTVRGHAALSQLINTTTKTAAECQATVRELYPGANAAEFSNLGQTWCKAVFNAAGVVYDPEFQTCIFDVDWDVSNKDGAAGGRRHLATMTSNSSAGISSVKFDTAKTMAPKGAAALQALQSRLALKPLRGNGLISHTQQVYEAVFGVVTGSFSTQLKELEAMAFELCAESRY
eukprot:COSAG05_NODE_1798_length_4039_cov_7.678086_4_plen_699_part_00